MAVAACTPAPTPNNHHSLIQLVTARLKASTA
jgi:hypothetical protein